MRKVRWAVVGTSDFALNWIARGIKLGKNAELAAVVSRDAARGAAAAEQWGAPHTYTSLEEIDKAEVDGVFLVLPSAHHASYAIAAARLGFHVIGEKPMAPTLDECRQMLGAARESGVLLAIAQCMEFTAPMVKARELLEAGAIGEIVSATISASFVARPRTERRRPPVAPEGAEGLFDMGVHAVDAITRLVGPVARVGAVIDTRLTDTTAGDSATLLLHFASGVQGALQAHYTANQNGLEIQGTHGRIWSDAWWGREFAGDLHMQRGNERIDFELPTVNVYVPQIEHVSDCVLSGTQPVISGERGMANIAVIEAAYEAARTGRMVDVVRT
jgi:glucose-fructose oxidoreductase